MTEKKNKEEVILPILPNYFALLRKKFEWAPTAPGPITLLTQLGHGGRIVYIDEPRPYFPDSSGVFAAVGRQRRYSAPAAAREAVLRAARCTNKTRPAARHSSVADQ